MRKTQNVMLHEESLSTLPPAVVLKFPISLPGVCHNFNIFYTYIYLCVYIYILLLALTLLKTSFSCLGIQVFF